MSIMDQASHRKSFIVAIITKMVRSLVLIVFFQAIFLQVDHIASWSRPQVFVLITLYLTVESIVVITFHRNLAYYLPDHLRKGTFDYLLVSPLPLLPHVTFRIIDCMDIIATVPVVCALWIYILMHHFIVLTPITLVWFGITGTLTFTFLWSMNLLIAGISFWTLIPTGMGRLYEQLFRTSRYPLDSLGAVQGFLFTFIIPFALVGTIPARVLVGASMGKTLLFTVPAILVIALASLAAWRRGVRHYSSASS